MLQKDKISNLLVRQLIVSEISKAFEKHGEFSTAGLCCYGYEFSGEFKVTLVTRSQKTVVVKTEGHEPRCWQTWKVGDTIVACALPKGHDGEHAPKEALDTKDEQAVQITIPASGKAGKKAKKHGTGKDNV